MLLEVVEGNPLLQVSPRRGKLAKPEERIPQCPVSLYEMHGILEALGQDQQLFCQLSRHLQLRPRFMKDPQSPQDREHVRRLPHLPT